MSNHSLTREELDKVRGLIGSLVPTITPDGKYPSYDGSLITSIGGSSVFAPEIPLTEESDMAAYLSGNTYTLPENSVIGVYGTVTLTAGRNIILPASSEINGRSNEIDGFSGSYAGPLVTVSDLTSNQQTTLNNLFIQNTASDPSAQAISYDVPNGILAMRFSRFLTAAGGGYAVHIQDALTVALIGNVIIGGSGFLLGGIVGDISFYLMRVIVLNPTGVGFNLSSALSVPGRILWDIIEVVTTAGTQTGYLEDAGASINTNIARALLHSGSGTANVGFNQASPDWRISESNFLPLSTYKASISIASSLTVPNVGPAFVDVADGINPVWSLSADSERVTLDATAGAITYVGKETISCLLVGNISANIAAGTNQFEIEVAINGTPRAESRGIGDLSNRTNSIALAPIVVKLAPGDVIHLVVRNVDTTQDLTVLAAGLGFAAAI